MAEMNFGLRGGLQPRTLDLRWHKGRSGSRSCVYGKDAEMNFGLHGEGMVSVQSSKPCKEVKRWHG
jgi:hypothetical protein